MELLVISDDLRAYPRPEFANVDEFKKLIRRDRGSPGDSGGKKKQRASMELAYIFHLVDPGSPYRVYEESLRAEKVKGDLFKDYPDWEPDPILEAALAKYCDLKRTPTTELLKAAMSAVNKLTDYFDKLDFTLTDDNGRPIYNAKDVVSNLSNLGKVVEGLQKLREQVEREESQGTVNRKSVKTSKYSE